MFRLNCNISDDISERLHNYCARTGITKSNVVAMALDNYLSQEEMKLRLMARMSDPEEMAKIYKMLGSPSLKGGDEVAES